MKTDPGATQRRCGVFTPALVVAMIVAVWMLSGIAEAFDTTQIVSRRIALESRLGATLPEPDRQELVQALADKKAGDFEELEEAQLFVVYAFTDNDAQVMIRAESDDPIHRLFIWSPEERLVVNLLQRDGGKLGFADIAFDSPEPTVEELEAAYPEGEYLFVAVTVSREILVAEVELSYDLPDPPVVTYPAEGDEGVPLEGFEITWDVMEGVEAILVEIEDEEEEVKATADLGADATSFAPPPGWMQPGVEYTVDVEAIAENGNITVVDLQFETAD